MIENDEIITKLLNFLTRSDELISGGCGAGFTLATRIPGRATALNIDGARVVVKLATCGVGGLWRVNFHCHGKLDERGVDAYLIVLLNVPGQGKQPLYLVMRAPLGRVSIQFSFRSIVRQYAENVEDWPTLRAICKAKFKAAKANKTAPK